MYGTLKTPLLWYTLFTNTLKEEGFTINPYNKCVANKIINGKQFTICWYVDDIKFSHKEKSVVKDIVKRIEERFDKISVTHGNSETYLGIDFTLKNRMVYMEMEDYLKDCIDDFPEAINVAAKTPSTKNLMKISEDLCPLDQQRKEIFNSIVQKLIHVSKRSRLDLHVIIGFLCTRV